MGNGDLHEFIAGMLRRMIRSAGRRVGEGDIAELESLLNLQHELECSIADAVAGLIAEGYSWAEVAAVAGVTRQAAHRRWAGRAGRRPA